MIDRAMVAKSARYLAPIALAAVVVGIYLIVHAGLNPPSRTVSHSTQTTAGGGGHHGPRRTAKYYVVKRGQTLSEISIKTHVPIYRITILNPGLSPDSLQTGQRLRLRR
jgi:LysM repeat protein